MRPEFVEEPGSGVLLSDAVCSERLGMSGYRSSGC